MHVDHGDLQSGMTIGERRERSRNERADGRREAGQAHPPGGQPYVRGQFGAGSIDPPDDLGRAIGQQPPGLGESDAAPDPLHELGTRLSLEYSQMVADRRLRVVQLLRSFGDRSMAGDGVDDPQPCDVQHASTLSINDPETTHWTHATAKGRLPGVTTMTRSEIGLSGLLGGIRSAVAARADWGDTARLVADQ